LGTGDDPVPLFEDFVLGGKLRAVKEPVRVGHEFVIAFVVLVQRGEEGHRVGDMDHYGNAQFAAFCPYGVNARIVHRDELAGLVPAGEAERFEYLEAARAHFIRFLQAGGFLFAEIGLVNAAEIRREEYNETFLGDRLEIADVLFITAVPRLPVERYAVFYPGGVHFGQIFSQPRGVDSPKVIVEIDNRESGILNLGFLGHHLTFRLPVAEKKRSFFLRGCE